MPVGVIPVDTYTVQISRSTGGPHAVIKISGPEMTHQIKNRAILAFSISVEQFVGVAHNVGGLNFNGIDVIAGLPFADFNRMYDLLRNESPVQLLYNYTSSVGLTKTLLRVTLETGNEQPGEGPEDPDSVEQHIRFVLKSDPYETPTAK